MFKESKMMTISFLIIYMLIPFAGDIMKPWVLALLVAVCGLVAELALGRGKNIFASMRFHQEFLMLAAAVLSFGMAALCGSGVIGSGGDGSVFIYLGLFALLFYVMRAQDTVRMAQFDLIFCVGSAALLLYLVSYAIAIDTFLVPACVLYDKTLTNALAVVNGMIAAWGFCREKDHIRCAMYCAGGVVAFFVIALNDTPGMLLLLLAGIYAFLMTVPPGMVYVRRGLSVFTGAAFLACNLSLIVNYTKFFRVGELSYSLQASVLAELVLSVFLLYVVSVWDKLKENGKLNKNGLSLLQEKLRKLVIFGGKPAALFLIFCGIHLWVGLDQFMLLFFGDKWAAMQEGMIVSVLTEWIVRISGALAGLWNGNIIALCYRAGGVPGFLLGAAVVAWTLWQVWTGIRARKNMRLAVIVCGEIFALLLLMPVSVELLPFFAVWIYLLICDLQPKQGKKCQ
ncbi:MAG: hypothetical protein NC254_03610 [bacterium]|nr:hypothetical protein [bacterium]